MITKYIYLHNSRHQELRSSKYTKNHVRCAFKIKKSRSNDKYVRSIHES